MTLLQGLALVAAGLLAGTASALAGGASIVSFPVLLALGVPPLSANVTNTVGLATIALGAVGAPREELSRRAPLCAGSSCPRCWAPWPAACCSSPPPRRSSRPSCPRSSAARACCSWPSHGSCARRARCIS